jgi:hypothetical protein
MSRFASITLLVLACGFAARADEPAKEFAKAVKIEFPKDGYTLTRADAAKGAKLEYKIVVAEDRAGVVALPFGPSFHEPAGPSGLHPREAISGNNQRYCLEDFGLAFPPKGKAATLKKGEYKHAFEWDGRNWSGPSDTGQKKGPAFPAGTYDVTVTIHGELETAKGRVPYSLTEKTKLVLK